MIEHLILCCILRFFTISCMGHSPVPPSEPSAITPTELLRRFSHTLSNKNNYLPVVRGYLDYTLQTSETISPASAQEYFKHYAEKRKLGYNITSPVNKLLAYCQQHQITNLVADLTDARLSRPANQLLDAYFASSDSPQKASTRATYRSVLAHLFHWLETHRQPLGPTSVRTYLRQRQQERSASTIASYFSIIKSLSRWMAIYPEHWPEGFSVDKAELTALLSLRKIL